MAAERLIITGRIAWRLETAGRLDAEGVIPVKTSSQTLTVAWTHTFG
jgi:hypothetical protein